MRNNILQGVFLIQLFFFASCLMIIPSCDWATDLTIQEWLDSFNDPEPVQIDTCTLNDLHQVNDPKFIASWVAFDCSPDSILWRVINVSCSTEDLAATIWAANPSLDTVEVYVSEREVAIIMAGSDDKAWIEGRISCRPSCNGIKHLPATNRRALYLNNAPTFEEWMGIMDRYPSNASMNMRSDSLTQNQKDKIWENQLDYDSCKVATTSSPLPNRIDFRFDSTTQLIRDRFKERNWNTIE